MHLSVDEIKLIAGAIGFGYAYGTKFGVACLRAWQKRRKEREEADPQFQMLAAERRLREIETPINIDGMELDDETRDIIEERNHWLLVAKRNESSSAYYKRKYEELLEKQEQSNKSGGGKGPSGGSSNIHNMSETRSHESFWRRRTLITLFQRRTEDEDDK